MMIPKDQEVFGKGVCKFGLSEAFLNLYLIKIMNLKNNSQIAKNKHGGLF